MKTEEDLEISQSFDQIDIKNLDESFVQASGGQYNVQSTQSLQKMEDTDEKLQNEQKQPIMVFKNKKSPSMKRSPSFAESGFSPENQTGNGSNSGVYEIKHKQNSVPVHNKTANNIFKTPSKVLSQNKEKTTGFQNNYYL